MMHSVIEAIYDTYCTAAFQPPPRRDQHEFPRRAHSVRALDHRPQRSLLAEPRKVVGYALSSLGNALQIGGDRLIGIHRAGSA